MLGVIVSVVDIRQIGRHSEKSRHKNDACGFCPAREAEARCGKCFSAVLRGIGLFLRTQGLYEISQYDEEHYESEIVGHLYVVGKYLKGREECGHRSSQ